MNDDERRERARRRTLEEMLSCLRFWEEAKAYFGTDYPLALQLVERCRAAGASDPAPWLTLCDLIEERGDHSSIRDLAWRIFDLPPNSGQGPQEDDDGW